MDSFLRQMRFSNIGNKEEPSSSERRIPLQKTQSFKGENKKTQNWLRRQFSRQMSRDHDSNDQMEQAAAVAAAAYAIKSLQEPDIKDRKEASGGPQPFLAKLWSKKEDAEISMPEQKQTSEGLEPSLTRLKSRKEDIPISRTEPGRASKRFSGEDEMRSPGSPDSKEHIMSAVHQRAPDNAVSPPLMKKRLTFADEHLEIADSDTIKEERMPPKVTDPSRSMKETLSFAEELLKDKNALRLEGGVEETDLPPTKHEAETSRPDILPTFKPATPPPETRRETTAKPGTDETEADSWMRAEMAKIQERYEKLNETILTWENKKKKKAKTRLDGIERGLERRRLKALQKFRSEVDSIDQIAGGARAQALERRRNEELKAKEKANKIRRRGKVPANCFCF